jgi:hypothetical protein
MRISDSETWHGYCGFSASANDTWSSRKGMLDPTKLHGIEYYVLNSKRNAFRWEKRSDGICFWCSRASKECA